MYILVIIYIAVKSGWIISLSHGGCYGVLMLFKFVVDCIILNMKVICMTEIQRDRTSSDLHQWIASLLLH